MAKPCPSWSATYRRGVADHLFTLADRRSLSFDDVGDPDGAAVLYIHGTPDSAKARHPNDELATQLGVRLVAVDRPGSGRSTVHPTGTVGSFADDAVALADHLGIDRWRPFGWSAGATFALAIAARHPDRTNRVAVAAGLVPFAAYSSPGILDDADGGRYLVAEMGAELGPAGLAEVAAPMVAPIPCDLPLAREHVLETATPDRRAVLEAQPGALDAMAQGLVDAVAQGDGGIVRDLELQVETPDVDWAAATCPVDLWYGGVDSTAPPAFGAWWADHLRWAELTIEPAEGHLIALTRWEQILARLAMP